MTVRITPLPTAATLEVGADLASAALDGLEATDLALADGDVLVVASKVVALAEGRLVDLDPGTDPHTGRRDLAREQARRVVADHPRVLVVETHHGLVCANAGIDTSNVPPGKAVLLPKDPDASARRLRAALAARTGATIGVVVTDTFGRPWREGQVDVAIGAAGITVLRDERRDRDLWGRALEVTVAALADEVAAAADLVRRKDSGGAFVLVRGLHAPGDGAATDLVRVAAEDLFPAGGPTMADHVVARGATVPSPPTGDPRAHLALLAPLAAGPGVTVRVEHDPGDGSLALHLDAVGDGPAGLVALGGALARLELVVAARGWLLRAGTITDGRVPVRVEPPGTRSDQSSTTNAR